MRNNNNTTRFLKILFIINVVLTNINFINTETCKILLHEVANSQMLFTFCATTNAVPVSVCIGCDLQYTEMIIKYSNLHKNTNCSARYFDKDRINIVQNMQDTLTGIWSRGNCDDCFNSNNSQVFEIKSKELEACLNRNKNKECEKCLLDYQDLNDFYSTLENKNKGNVCYDMQDSMNRTRSHWSKDLNCCTRLSRNTYFLIVMCLVTSLPIIFYSSAYKITKYRERNHILLNEDTESERSLQHPIPTLSSGFNTNSMSAPANKIISFDSDSDDDDDENDDSDLNKNNI